MRTISACLIAIALVAAVPRSARAGAPQYIYETAFGDGTNVVGHGHYFFLTLVGRLDLSPEP